MLQTVQAARGLAALAVAAYHLSIAFGDPKNLGFRVLEQFTWKGNLGVDFFFVLSGFIMMLAHHDEIGQRSRWINYIIKRFIRLYPIYWVYTVVLMISIFIGFGSHEKEPHNYASIISTVSLIRLNNFVPPLMPAWTLFHEVAFYFLFSSFFFDRRMGIVIFLGWFIAISYVFTYASVEMRTPFYTYLSAYNLDFMIGMISFVLWRYLDHFDVIMVAIFGSVLFVASYGFEAHGMPFSGYPLFYAIGFGGVLAGLASWEANQREISIPILNFLGNASYTIYLTHESFMGNTLKILVKCNLIKLINPYCLYFSLLAFSLFCGGVAYWMVERPLIRLLRKLLVKPSSEPDIINPGSENRTRLARVRPQQR